MPNGEEVSHSHKNDFKLFYYAFYFSGPQMPRKMADFSLIKTSQGLLAVGGARESPTSPIKRWSEIYKLNCEDDIIDNCQWEETEHNLLVPRADHVTIPLPESYDICT